MKIRPLFAWYDLWIGIVIEFGAPAGSVPTIKAGNHQAALQADDNQANESLIPGIPPIRAQEILLHLARARHIAVIAHEPILVVTVGERYHCARAGLCREGGNLVMRPTRATRASDQTLIQAKAS